MSNELLICIDIDKEPYVKKLSDDKIINLTGESGSGKSYFSRQYESDDFIVVDTDEVYSRFDMTVGYNKEFGNYLRNKYEEIPSLFENFDLFYEEVILYFKDCDKTIVIDSAQFRNMKDIYKLKGTLIVMRTSIDTCYNRCIDRYNEKFPNASTSEKEKYAEKKKAIYKWFVGLNNFLEKVNRL